MIISSNNLLGKGSSEAGWTKTHLLRKGVAKT